MIEFLGGLTALIVLFALNVYLAAVQSAYYCFPKPTLEELGDLRDRDVRTDRLVRLLERPRRVDIILRFANMCVRILFLALLLLLLLRAGDGIPLILVLIADLLLASILLGPGELFSRSYGIQNAESFALSAVPITRFLVNSIGPPLTGILDSLKAVTDRFGIRRIIPYLTVEELIAVVEAGEKEGQIEEDEREMMHSIFELGDTAVREVMVPRVDMVTVDQSATLHDALEKIRLGGHSRIPVFEDTIDTIVGVVYAKDLLRGAEKADWKMPVAGIMREASFVTEGKKVDELLREFREKKVHLAVVVDEYGGTAGLITLEDVIEEIVGEIEDEHDPESQLFREVSELTAVVVAKIAIDDLNKLFRINIPADRHDTLGGYLYDLVDRVPSEGETISEGGLVFTVESVVRQRITRVRITKSPSAGSLDGEGRSDQES